MEKVVYLVQRAPGISLEDFRARYLSEHVPLVLQHCPRLRRYTVNLLQRDDYAFCDAIAPPFEGLHAVLEFWVDAIEDFADKSRMYASPAGRAAVRQSADGLVSLAMGYRVREGVQRDYDRDWPLGQETPGWKLVAPLRRKEGLSHEEFARHWTSTHAPLALEHVLGMWRYVTNEVMEPITPGAPEIDGIVSVNYRDKRSYASPESEAIMRADTDSFLQQPMPLRMSEWVMLGAA